jgi:hypothetical protein
VLLELLNYFTSSSFRMVKHRCPRPSGEISIEYYMLSLSGETIFSPIFSCYFIITVDGVCVTDILSNETRKTHERQVYLLLQEPFRVHCLELDSQSVTSPVPS